MQVQLIRSRSSDNIGPAKRTHTKRKSWDASERILLSVQTVQNITLQYLSINNHKLTLVVFSASRGDGVAEDLKAEVPFALRESELVILTLISTLGSVVSTRA